MFSAINQHDLMLGLDVVKGDSPRMTCVDVGWCHWRMNVAEVMSRVRACDKLDLLSLKC